MNFSVEPLCRSNFAAIMLRGGTILKIPVQTISIADLNFELGVLKKSSKYKNRVWLNIVKLIYSVNLLGISIGDFYQGFLLEI